MYKLARKSWLKHLDITIIDLIMISLAYLLAVVFRNNTDTPFYNMELLPTMWLASIVIHFCVALAISNYKNIIRRTRWQELQAVFIQEIVTLAVLTIFMYMLHFGGLFSRYVYASWFILSIIFVYAARIVWKRIVRLHLLNNSKLPHMLVVASDDAVEDIIKEIKHRRYNAFYVSGIVVSNADRKGQEIAGIPVVCNYSELKDYCLKEVVDEAFLSLADRNKQNAVADYMLEMGITVHSSLLEDKRNMPNSMVEKMGGHMVLTTTNSTASGFKLAIKRVVDIIGALVGLLFTGLIFIYVAPKIKKVDPGPVFFKQKRVGKNGRIFEIYKFRSMYMDAEARKAELMAQNDMDGLMFKMDNDPRILPGIGNFIRDKSLDEFPQFLNVLKGDMSLVGTRPPTVGEFEQYAPHHKMRLSFKPGISGLWQVSGRSNITDFEEVVALDNQYIKEWSLKLDMQILVKTVGVVVKGEGAK